MLKRFFSVKEAAAYSGLSARLIYQKLKERALRHFRVGKKIVVDVGDLDAFIMRSEVKSADELIKELRTRMDENKRRKKKG